MDNRRYSTGFIFLVGVMLSANLVCAQQPEEILGENEPADTAEVIPFEETTPIEQGPEVVTGENVDDAVAIAEETQEVDQMDPEDPDESGETIEKAAEAAPKDVKPRTVNMNQLITLDLRSMDVNDALTYISLRSGANIVASKAVTGRVTLQLKDVSLQDVFDITLITNGLALEKYGDIFYVMTEKEYEARYGKSFADIRQVRMYQLKYAIPEKAFDLLDTLKSTIGRILVDQESGTILMVDTEEKLDEMEATLQTLEKKGDVNIFNLQYALATDVEERLRVQLDDKNVGSIWSDERSNQVIVRALPDRMVDVKEIIAALDKKTLEVLIDAKIVQIQLSDSLETGFEWEGLFQELFDSGGGGFLGSHPFEPVLRANQTFIDDFTTIPPEDANPSAGSKVSLGEKIFFGNVDKNHSFEAVMKFLATLGETRLLSNPKLAVVNNQEARIHVGRQEAYITSTTTSGQTTTTTAEDVTFVNVGIQLSVTPTINEEGFVTMKIKPEVSSVVDTLVTPSGNQIPIIDTSLAETTVLVKDDSTIIIGGLRRDEETESSKRVPFLGDLPLLGNLFRSQTKGTQRNELLVMITPHIVDGTHLYSGDVDDPDNESTKSYTDYDSYDTIPETYGPDFGKLDYKSFR